jgi:hypothetical protein
MHHVLGGPESMVALAIKLVALDSEEKHDL